jgi:nucleoside-diphosphate-sugar epimerase
MKKIIVVAGATGDLGGRIVKALLKKGAEVRALVRSSSDIDKVKKLEQIGVKIFKIDMSDSKEIAKACEGAACVVSALAGLRDVIITTQKKLLDGAVMAGVPHFIPSDFSIDFTNLEIGQNRNLDLRREFHRYLDESPIASTTIFNGPFMDLLTDKMPMILDGQKWILYWGNPDQSIDFTTMDDTAEYTANVALDDSAPQFLRIAGDQITPRQMVKVMSDVTGKEFSLFRPGGIGLINTIIKTMKFFSPSKRDLYPIWQGMQYMRDMMEGRVVINSYDNNRYEGMNWTSIRELLLVHEATKKTDNQ